MKFKNIIIFTVIGASLVLVYIFFIKKPADTAGLVSTSGTPVAPSAVTSDQNNTGTGGEFLSVLLNVNKIKLNDSIFSDDAFLSLHDSSITLNPDPTTGRPNPFAPLEAEAIIPITTDQNTTIQAPSLPPTQAPTTPKSPATTPTKP